MQGKFLGRRNLTALAVAVLMAIPIFLPVSSQGARATDLGVYHTYDEMVSELQNISSAHPNITRLFSIGTTYENRTIWALKVSDNASRNEVEPNITVFGGIHARELLSVEVPLYILNYLTDNYPANATVRGIVDGTQLFVVPMLNPDGHVYVENTGDWRKNRRIFPNGIGVDINRNFGHLWGLEAGLDQQDEDYCGPNAFSENETQAVRELVTANHPSVALSYHSFGPYILYPWGNTLDTSAVDGRLPALASNMSKAMPPGRQYTPKMARQMYPATGDTDDYFFANLSILPFTVELSYSHRPPEGQVNQICADNLPAAMYLLEYVAAPAPRPPEGNHSLLVQGPQYFRGVPGSEVFLNFSVINTGDWPENLNYSVSTISDWACSVNRSSGILLPGEGDQLRLQITVSPGAGALETARFALTARAPGGANASYELTGVSDVVHNLTLELTGPAEVSSGAPVSFIANITNRGNGKETLTLSASSGAGWGVRPLPYPFNITPGETRAISAVVDVPQKALATGPVSFTFSAQTADGNFRVRETRELNVRPIHNVSLGLELHYLNFSAGENRTLSAVISNSGNVFENGTLVITGSTQFISISTRNISVPPYSNVSVDVLLIGKKGSWAMGLVLMSPSGDRLAADSLTFGVIGSTRPGPVPETNPVPLLIVMIMISVGAVVFVYWDHQKTVAAENRLRYRKRSRPRPLTRKRVMT